MKRKDMAARVRLIAEKRGLLLAAARESQRQDLSNHFKSMAEIDLEVRAIEYAAVVQRYIGGKT